MSEQSPLIKVCGMRDPDNIRAVEQLGVDWMGFIFWPGSSRYVSAPPAYLPSHARRVGVFVDATLYDIAAHVRDYGLHIVQLHGHESPDYCREVRSVCGDAIATIKAFSVANADDLHAAAAYEGAVNYFLFDTRSPLPGGSGRQFDWSILDAYDGATPFLLSGGISPDDLDRLLAFRYPRLLGFDLNSRFESAPALKDLSLLAPFINAINPHPSTHMNRINTLFSTKPSGILSLYFCAGHPTLDATATTIRTLARRGIDMIEVGIPFSDSMADGPVIQDAATKALRNGMTLRTLFAQLEDIRSDVSIPLILMGYLNPIIQFGIEAFCQRCAEVGIDGVIIPDLPFQDYLDSVKPVADHYDLRVIMLITPETSDERIRLIDDHTDGFIYMVSSAATTGVQRSFDEQKQAYFSHVDSLGLRNPRMIGFGISNRQTLTVAHQAAAGAIIGSKFVSLLDETCDADSALTLLNEALAQ